MLKKIETPQANLRNFVKQLSLSACSWSRISPQKTTLSKGNLMVFWSVDKNNFKKVYSSVGVILIILIFFLLLPIFSFAQGTLEIVPCQDDCTACDFYVLAANVFRFMWYLATFLAILFIVWGGFLMLISGASPGNLQKGKNTVWNAIIGLIITFISWMIINTFIHFLINPDVFPVSWSEPQC